MMKSKSCFLLLLLLLSITSVFAESSVWNFTTPSDYSYNTSLVNVTGGVGKLVGTSIAPVGWWHMNEASGSTVNDSSGYGNNGTATNTVVVSGKLGNGRYFDGAGDYINFGTSSSLSLVNATLEVWVNISTMITARILSKYGSAADNRNYQMFTYSDGRLYCAMTDSTGTDQAITQTVAGTLVAGNWYHIVYTYDGAYGRLYINGVLNKTSTAWSGTVGTGATQPFYLGTHTTASSAVFNGTMDEAAVYNVALNATEIATRYNSGIGTENPFPTSYPISNPAITPRVPINITTETLYVWKNFTENSTKPANTDLKYILSNDNSTWKWWNGTAWAASNQSYNQSSNASDVNANIGTFPITNNYLNWKSLLNSNGSVTPELDNLNISYYYNIRVYSESYSSSIQVFTKNTFTWTSNEPSNTTLRVWNTSLGYDDTNTNASLVTSHSIQSDNLTQVGRYNFNLSSQDESGTASIVGTFDVVSELIIVFLNQTPSDIDTLNTYGTGVNARYDISSPAGINASSVLFYHKTNGTTKDGNEYINGSFVTGWDTAGINITNVSSIWNFYIEENDIYPGSYNIYEFFMTRTVPSFLQLNGTNDYVKVELLNMSNSTPYNIFEMMVINNSAVTNPISLYYCNSSYATGNIAASPNCVLFATQNGTAGYNHSHSNYSKHQLYIVPIDTATGTINGIKITPTSYFVVGGVVSAGQWNVSYISNVSRTGAAQLTTNKGTAWGNVNGTINAHIHQYTSNETFRYYICASDLGGVSNCSAERYDLIGLANLRPSLPVVTSPINITYTNGINITYYASISPNSYPIVIYKINLLNSTGGYYKNITSNNSNNLFYFWSPDVPIGNYSIEVTACDSIGQCSIPGLSAVFSLSSVVYVTLYEPANNSKFLDIQEFIFSATTSTTGNLNCSLELTFIAPYIFTTGTVVPGIINSWSIYEYGKVYMNGNYYWRVFCMDVLNTTGSSPYWKYTIGERTMITNVTQIYGTVTSPYGDFKTIFGLMLMFVGIWGAYHYTLGFIRF